MDADTTRDCELVARLKRLDAQAALPVPEFDYAGMIERHAARRTRAHRRLAFTRATAGALALALVGAGMWRFVTDDASESSRAAAAPAPAPAPVEEFAPRIVRADTYLAVAALEDHIASLDDALNAARLGQQPADIAGLERTRAELIDSYTRVRYAERVSASF